MFEDETFYSYFLILIRKKPPGLLKGLSEIGLGVNLS